MKTEFNKVQGLFHAASGNSFSLVSDIQFSSPAEALIDGSIANGDLVDGVGFTLTDALDQSVTFIVDVNSVLFDGSVDASGRVIIGTQGAANVNTKFLRAENAINSVTSFDQSQQAGAPAGQEDLKLDITAIRTGSVIRLKQNAAGGKGNTVIPLFLNGNPVAQFATVEFSDFSGGLDGGSESATGIHYFLEEVTIDQDDLGGNPGKLGLDEVAVQLSHKLPENAVIINAAMIQSSEEGIEEDSGNYGLQISSLSKDAGEARAGGNQSINVTLETGINLSGTTDVMPNPLQIEDKQFLHVYSTFNNDAETGTVKLLVAIQYAGMGEPIKI